MRRLERTLLLKNYRQLCTLSKASFSPMLDTQGSDQARLYFDGNPPSRNILSCNRMLAAHVRNDQTPIAQDLFDQMLVKDVVSWNTMLTGLQKAKNPHGVNRCFLQMRRDGFRPSEYTISTVLNAFLGTAFNVLVSQIHALVVRLALSSSVFVGSALIKGYANTGDQIALSRVFDEIPMKDVSSSNALVSSYMELGCTHEAQRVFDVMLERNIVSWTSLVSGYINNKRINKARSVFDKMRERNVVSWTVMISGYVKNQKFMDALDLFLLMLKSGALPNHFTFSSVLDACAGCSSLIMGQQVHSSILKLGTPEDVIMSTSLVDMYAKCGDIEAAFCVFGFMPRKNLVTWNSIIGGSARHGLATRALDKFERMIKCGVRPDEVTFVNVLSACGHGGMVEKGEKLFNSMKAKFGIEPNVEHYACMVDLYARAGNLEEAEKLIQWMPFQPDVVIWVALLGACGLHSSLQLGEFAAKEIEKLRNDHPAIYSTLSKIHGERGVWDSVLEFRKIMKEKHIQKQIAGSWVESQYRIR
ncbi:pentatricopeptide repeat-containing protein At2g13600-like isoform X1 [Prunus avium]|uniref:Pentatricopeptide repeat-containing protein At2g13600-like isoform X1 n=1 Tax=Prunus avium TaxID=42229 RepID=A0A6P5SGE5_PRUAV|nr:pentatricopeptide repeat-containing protein At2g13600-like isoform X1 [Prunus avium]